MGKRPGGTHCTGGWARGKETWWYPFYRRLGPWERDLVVPIVQEAGPMGKGHGGTQCAGGWARGKETWCLFNRRLVRPQGWSGQVWKILSPPGFNPGLSSPYRLAILIMLFQPMTLIISTNINCAPCRVETYR